ncbi:urease accessory protein UreD [Nakamurella endophytica]|uniref:Urease accessory protein UreD n=1 Tax=Nakamurella endophytica TaxID=1748367 RepID=A0A917WNA1_9ACTN|nr:urease accessory protein UreD [Nakamurella endophytica]GGM16790.1 hypothetical protein GCM10011594_41050 [Nakamurella endophytica]
MAGRSGSTRVEVSGSPERPRIRTSSGMLAARILSGPTATADPVRVALVATQALLLGGDHAELSVRVGAGLDLELVEVGGTVAYDADGRGSAWSADVEIDRGGRLRWAAEPFVVADGAAVQRRTGIRLAEEAAAALRETFVLGRTGERGGSLVARTRVDLVGAPLYAEDLDLSDADLRSRPGVLGPARVLDQLAVFGGRAPDVAGPSGAGCRRFELDGPGTVIRYLGPELARSPLADLWQRWRPGLCAVRV